MVEDSSNMLADAIFYGINSQYLFYSFVSNSIPQNHVMPDSLRLEEVENVSYAKRILTAKRGPTTVTHVHLEWCLMLDQHRQMIVVLVSSQYYNELC